MAKSRKLEVEVLNPKKVKPEYEVLHEEDHAQINRLIEVYKENPYHARIIFKQNSKLFRRNRIVAYRYENGDINIVHFLHSFGISRTNKIYQSEKNMGCIIYKKETNKWYVKRNGFKLLTYNELTKFHQFCGRGKFETSTTYDYILKELPWLRNLSEDKHKCSHVMTFNTIISKKLFNLKAIYRHLFKTPYPIIEVITQNKGSNSNNGLQYFQKMWVEMLHVLKNVENLNYEMLNSNIFMDACKMADSLGKKINCSWGLARLKLEHDAWAKEISNVLLLVEKNTQMDIYHVYRDFADYSQYQLLETNYDMIHDGLMMRHCVATYINKVNGGSCAIYKVDGHTMEVKIKNDVDNKNILYFNQIRGYDDKDASIELKMDVQRKLDYFNTHVLPDIELKPIISTNKTSFYQYNWNNDVAVDLPF